MGHPVFGTIRRHGDKYRTGKMNYFRHLFTSMDSLLVYHFSVGLVIDFTIAFNMAKI